MIEECLRMSGDALETAIMEMLSRERRATVRLLWHLAAFEEKEIFAEKSYPSMFCYCTRRLGLSEGAAYRRIHAARALREYPEVAPWLEDGRIHLSGLTLLAPHLKDGEVQELLVRAAGRTKREMEMLVAEIAPKPDLRDVILRFPSTAPQESTEDGGEDIGIAERRLAETAKPPGTASYDVIAPRSPERIRFCFSAGPELLSKVDRAKQLLRHKFPAGKLEDVLDDALEALLDKRDPDRRIARKLKRAKSSGTTELQFDQLGV